MKIKQQKMIRAYLTEEFGPERGDALFAAQDQALMALAENIRDASPSQEKTLTQTILPRVALYRVLLDRGFSQEEALACLRKYMMDRVAAKKQASTAKMEKIPGFYDLYSRIFLKVMGKSDAWKSTQRRGRDDFDVTIQECLWHRACQENGCGELCRLFCDVDDVTYGGLRKMGFSRTKTLGYGGDCCDFHFFRK